MTAAGAPVPTSCECETHFYGRFQPLAIISTPSKKLCEALHSVFLCVPCLPLIGRMERSGNLDIDKKSHGSHAGVSARAGI